MSVYLVAALPSVASNAPEWKLIIDPGTPDAQEVWEQADSPQEALVIYRAKAGAVNPPGPDRNLYYTHVSRPVGQTQ